MVKRFFIIHGWDGHPNECWFPWLKKELENKNFKVFIPQMPNPEAPEIKSWISSLEKVVKNPDKETYFVGHSIGCQAILRYLEKLPQDIKFGGVVFVAGWINLKPTIAEEEGSSEIAKPWLETSIAWNKVLQHTNKFTAIFSDNDPYVYVSDSEIFKEKLNAKVILEHNKGHIGNVDNIKEDQIILKSVLEIANQQ